MKDVIEIQGRKIGEGHPLFIVSECGVTCNHSLDTALKLVDATADAGADAIKFTYCFPEEFMSDRNVTYEYETVQGKESENMYEMLQNRLSVEEWRKVQTRANERGIIMFASVDAETGVQYCEALSFPAYKMGSWDYNHIPLWKRVAAIGKPMLIDTGPVTLLDVAKVIQVMKDAGNDQALLVYCFHTQEYPEMNMRAMPYMRDAFNCPVGYSPEGRDDETDIMAVTLGACVLEKRLTISRDLPGHHHILSKEPDEFKAYVKTMRTVHASLGSEDLIPSEADLIEKKKWFRSLVANRDLGKGHVISEDDLIGKRPMNGVSPEHIQFFLGRELNRDLKENEAISLSDI